MTDIIKLIITIVVGLLIFALAQNFISYIFPFLPPFMVLLVSALLLIRFLLFIADRRE